MPLSETTLKQMVVPVSRNTRCQWPHHWLFSVEILIPGQDFNQDYDSKLNVATPGFHWYSNPNQPGLHPGHVTETAPFSLCRKYSFSFCFTSAIAEEKGGTMWSTLPSDMDHEVLLPSYMCWQESTESHEAHYTHSFQTDPKELR